MLAYLPVTSLADAAKQEADMLVSIPKTFSQHVGWRSDKVKITSAEAASAQSKLDYRCDFCMRTFKTQKAMRIHRNFCVHQYDTTNEVFVVEAIIGAFGWAEARWMLVKFEGYEDPE